jgi:putative ABC transport system ATP-binding protein
LILADEPTGNLDAKNAQKILQVLQFLKSQGKTVIVSPHDLQIQKLADLVFCLENGKLGGQNVYAGFPINNLLRRKLQAS